MALTRPLAGAPFTTEWANIADYRAASVRAAARIDPASVYERYAAHYAAFGHALCPDDRAEGLAALDLSYARHVAEIGCGPGYYAPVIAARHPTLRVTGIDNAPAQIALARRRATRQGLHNVRFVRGDVCALSQPSGCFDRIVVSRLFMVVHDCCRAMAELRRVLAPGGILVLAEPVARPAISFAAWARVPAPTERIFTASAFAALVSLVAWGSCATWETGGYRYARCRKARD